MHMAIYSECCAIFIVLNLLLCNCTELNMMQIEE